jgi:hypothetical protein
VAFSFFVKIGIADGFAFSLGAFVSFSCSEPSQNMRGYTYEENAPKNVRFRLFPATLAKPLANSLSFVTIAFPGSSSLSTPRS